MDELITVLGSRELLTLTIGQLLDRYPFVASFFADEGLDVTDDLDWSLGRCLEHQRKEHPVRFAEGLSPVLERLQQFIEAMRDFVSAEEVRIESITILGGRDKQGQAEPVEELTIHAGEVICIVGPTGSGKSRLLADMEWMAQGDTPTGRVVLLDGKIPERSWRFSTEHKLVAQLSQNMNFVMDLSVEEFLTLHAESRRAAAPAQLVARISEAANSLAGEPFTLDTPITSLSGGQSRALMIADTAILSRSPIVLIDEIENAGIDRKRALDVLLREEKIVLMATHDPILALYGQRRVVLANGAMQKIITPTDRERASAEKLRELDRQLMALRHRLRQGELLEEV